MRAQPLSHRFVSLLLALVVLAASVGLPVQRRTCRLSGRSTARIAWAAALLGSSSTNSFDIAKHGGLTSNCYGYHLELHQLSTPAPAPTFAKLLPAAVLLALPAASSPTWLPRLVLITGRAFDIRPALVPPRPGGRRLLVRLRCWVV